MGMFFVLNDYLVVCFIFSNRSSFGYLEQCGLGGVEFRVAVDHGLHGWRIISNNQQSGAPVDPTDRGIGQKN